MSSTYFIPARLTLAVLLLALLLSAGSALQAQTEEGLLNKAAIKLKVKKYEEAAAILKQAREMYPTSVEVAKLTAELCEKRGDDPDSLIEAYRELIRMLKLKKVTEGRLDSKESRLLKKTEKKLAVVAKVRGEVDAAFEKLVSEGVKTCAMLARLEKYTAASFIYQRLSLLTKNRQLKSEVQNLAGLLEGNAQLVKPPGVSTGEESEKARRLISQARKALKAGNLNDARNSCMAALEADPGAARAREVLYEVAQKARDSSRALIEGLSYLLFSPQAQSAKLAQKVEKHAVKTVPELRAFFDSTAKAAGKVCAAAGDAVKSKDRPDVEYALLALIRLTHATKKVNATLSRVKKFLGGIMPWHRIFDGKSLAGWKLGRTVRVQDGCIELPGQPDKTVFANNTRIATRESFTFVFSFCVEETLQPSNPRTFAAITVKMWYDVKPFDESRAIYLEMHNCPELKTTFLLRPLGRDKKFYELAECGFSGPIFTPGKWHKVRVEYMHKKVGNSKVIVTIDGKRAVTVPVAQSVRPGRTGYVGILQFLYKSMKIKDIYLVP